MKFDVLDLFSGCGGLSYGFHKNNSFDLWGAFDNDIHANKTYLRNFGVTPICTDIGKLNANQITEALPSRKNDLLLLIGGPPCQGFSSHRKKDPRKDDRKSLVRKFVEIGCELKADAIVLENVPDLFAKKHWTHYKNAVECLRSNGYTINSGIVNMAEFRVPQERFRAILIAVKGRQSALPIGPIEREEFVTVRQAIGHLPPLNVSEQSTKDPMHITSKHRQSTIEFIKKVPKDGGSRPKGVGPKCLDRVNGFYDVYGRLYWDKPAVTITARCRTPSCGRFLHPEQHRGLSVREAALLQGFPPSFMFEGPFDDKFKQIGNAVPPAFSVELAKHIDVLLRDPNWTKENALQHYIEKPITNSFSTLIGSLKKNNKEIHANIHN